MEVIMEDWGVINTEYGHALVISFFLLLARDQCLPTYTPSGL